MQYTLYEKTLPSPEQDAVYHNVNHVHDII